MRNLEEDSNITERKSGFEDQLLFYTQARV